METIWSLFREAVARHGGRPAWRAEGTPVSYTALAERVRGLAARLVAAGVEPGDRVALLDVNSPAFLVAT